MSRAVFLVAVLLVSSGCQGEQITSGHVTAEAVSTRPVQPKPKPQDAAKVLEVLKQRRSRLGNIVVDYRTKITYPPLPAGTKAIVRPKGANYSIVRLTGTQQREKKFMLLGDTSRYDEKVTIIEGDARGPEWRPRTESSIRTYGPKRSEYLGLDKEGEPIRGVIYGPRPLPGAEIEIALALRAHGQTDRLPAEAMEGMALSLPDDGRAVLRCQDNANITHEWTFLRKRGYALSHYLRWPPKPEGTRHEATMSDFREVDGMILPHTMVLTSRTPSGGGFRTNVATEATVISYRMSNPTNTPAQYRIPWPVGTRVFDRRKRTTQPSTTRPATDTRPVAGVSTKPRSMPNVGPVEGRPAAKLPATNPSGR